MKNKPALKLSWRIAVPSYETDESFDGLREFLLAHREAVDEVAFFETVTHHLYLPLELFARRAEVLARRIASLKDCGIDSVGINVLCTLGHINEAWDYMPPLPFGAMVGHDGSVSRSCACPNTAEFRRYIRDKYRLMAQARPDFIWVDDDIRMHHHGIAWGCFCPTCLELFSAGAGRSWDRLSLVAALNDPAGGPWRQAWVAQNAQVLESLLSDVAQTLRSVSPAITTGLMTAGAGWTTYSGQALGRWLTALKATKTRPGGGFYGDEQPLGMVHKAFEVARQLVDLPAEVTDRQYELESFPYSTLSKSLTSVVNECTLALAAGCNGIAFNAIGALKGKQISLRKPLMDRISSARRMWRKLVEHAGDLSMAGLWPAWDAGLSAKRQVRPGESWFGGDSRYDIQRPNALAELGLPLTAAPSVGTVLSGRIAEAFSDEQLTQLLSGAVLMDSRALEVLAERGLQDLTGVRTVRGVDNGVKETLTDHEFNGPFAGMDRCAHIEFWGDARGLADVLEPTADGVHVLAVMRTYLDDVYGPCMTAFENRLGGRVMVMAYAPWMFLGSEAKREQILNAVDWATRGRLPLRIVEVVKLVPFVRLSADGTRGVAVLLNASTDLIEQATVKLRVPHVPCRHLASDGAVRPLETLREADGWSVRLTDIAPWSTTAILIGE